MQGALATVASDPVPGAAPGTASACFHCGKPNPEPGRWRAVVDGAPREFCCAGCQAIAQAIHVAGLDAFYERRTEAADRPEDEPAAAAERGRWDDPALQEGFVREAADGRREVSLLLEGIHCGACVWLIESWLARRPGVAAAELNFETRRARVEWDPAVTRLSEILGAVAAIGYHAYPYDPARREALARREGRALLLRMAVALLAMMQVMMFALPAYVTVDGVEPAHRRLLEWASLVLTIPVLLYSAAPFFRGAWRDLRMRRAGMDVPVALGLGAAFAASVRATLAGTGAVYYDSVTMFVALLQVARYAEFVARRRAGDAVEAVARARPATAERIAGWPQRRDVETVAASALAEGDVVVVRAGAVVPADGEVIEGRAGVDEAVLTGEARPRAAGPGSRVLAGSLARDGAIVIAVSAAGEATRLAAIERLVTRATGERPRAARVADRVAVWFVGALLALAAITGIAWGVHDPSRALAVTFSLLVVSCPCALSLATPAALAAASGALARKQVVVARGDALETLARVTHVVFDKTGTLTSGRVSLVEARLLREASREEAIALAAALEASSEHPLAAAFRAAAAGLALPAAESLSVVAGHGVEGVVAGRVVRLGRPEFAGALAGAPLPAAAASLDPATTHVALADGRGFIALFALGDTVREGARELVAELAGLGVAPAILSGDRAGAVAAAAERLGIGDARGDALPEDKRDAIAALQAKGAVVAMVGDGVNDAPSLAQAQVSVSLGSATPLAQRTADVVVLSDDLPRIALAIAHARRTFAVVRQNLAWAFVYNAVAIPAAAAGLVTPLAAAAGMSVSSLAVVANALRVARVREPRPAPLPRDRPRK